MICTYVFHSLYLILFWSFKHFLTRKNRRRIKWTSSFNCQQIEFTEKIHFVLINKLLAITHYIFIYIHIFIIIYSFQKKNNIILGRIKKTKNTICDWKEIIKYMKKNIFAFRRLILSVILIDKYLYIYLNIYIFYKSMNSNSGRYYKINMTFLHTEYSII